MTSDLRKAFKEHIESGETLVIDGNLSIDDQDLFEIPYLRVRGSLILKDMFNLHRIWGLEVAGDLTLESVDLVETLPRLCTVGKTLTVRHCTLLAELGDKLSCRALELDSCTSISILELGIEQCRSISLRHLKHLEIVTQKRLSWIPSEVTIDDCGLVMVPSGMKVGTSLKVIRCENLESVGSDVFSGGDMEFNGCGRLTSIGAKLFCGANLILKDTGLECLPEDMMVEGYVEVDGSAAIGNLKEIQVAGTEVRWRGKKVRRVGAGPVEQHKADEIMKMDDQNRQHQAILSLGTQEFLRQVAERFSRRKMDPEGVEKAVRSENGAADLFLLSVKGKYWEQDPRSYAIFKSVPGWYEIRTTYKFGLDWRQN